MYNGYHGGSTTRRRCNAMEGIPTETKDGKSRAVTTVTTVGTTTTVSTETIGIGRFTRFHRQARTA